MSNRHPQQFLSVVLNLAEFSKVTRLHIGVAVDGGLCEPLALNLSGVLDASAYLRRWLTGLMAGKVRIFDGGNLHLYVDSIQQRP